MAATIFEFIPIFVGIAIGFLISNRGVKNLKSPSRMKEQKTRQEKLHRARLLC
ncbi:hypothetical protein [Methanococcoides burtonii]|uniref:hypothetical protein n=1 Tax=Methanococcoides burtonii TaxID=29291 RepID=UPI000045E19B|nr:hypothetical protein [Methanococcoides burtonii]